MQPVQRLPRQPKIPTITIKNFHLGGLADSPYSGQKFSVLSLVGFDIHSVPGLIFSAQKLTQESGGAPTDDLYKILPCSDGNIYLFGQLNGKVYKNAGGTYTLLGTTAPLTGLNGVLDAIEFNGFIYYAMQNYLGQWNFANPFSTRNDSFHIFTVTNATYHPMLVIPNDLTLYIGDGYDLAQVDSTNTFTGNALAFTPDTLITCLGKQVTDLLIGASTANSIVRGHVFRWDTWSIAPINDYEIRQPNVNAFLQSDDTTIIVQAGNSGKLYYLNGAIFQPQKRIPPTFPNRYTPTSQMKINYPAVANLDGIPLLGVSYVQVLGGNPCYQGVYAYGSLDINYPTVLSLPYPISTGNLLNIVIWSIAVVGQTLYVSWKDRTSGSDIYGIDKIDYNNVYNGSFFETLLIKYSNLWLDEFKKAVVNYQLLPNGTNITISYDANWVGYIAYGQGEGDTLTNDTDRNEFVALGEVKAKTIKFKVTTTASGNNSPTIEDLVIYPT